MSVPLNGYRTSRQLQASGHASLYEAVREKDGRAVVARVFELESEEVEPRVEHEYALIEALDIEGVVKALALQRVGNQLVLLHECVPGRTLAAEVRGQPLELERFFSIAIQSADLLAEVHARRVIHRDIKPTNLLIDSDGDRVYLTGFGISALLDAERRHIYDRGVLEGTLPYISPEQTGRTGREVDARSDLYSLGVTFYELLTGRRPFEFEAPLELIHAHLARTPDPPQARRPDLPEGLSRLVMKLLEKAPEHRYQTAAGLAADLRTLRELVEQGEDGHTLELGREDFPRVLQLPHQLYGRLQERHELVDELERVMRSEAGRMMLLVGPPGIGKSALLADFEGPVAGFGGYLARGKFDVFREVPYAGFVDAFTALIEQLLTESEERLAAWRRRLTDALGAMGRVVCELVPKLELVIGEQPPVGELAPPEARNRLHLAVARFLSAFCEGDRPLVVVLDDLHWADRSSFALLRSLLDSGRRGALLVLGSYREGEVGPDHPLRELIEALADDHRIRVMRLRPLSESAVETLLADTLGRSAAEVRPLAQIVARKTANNPLFVRQFLTQIAHQGLLRPGEKSWEWDEQAIAAADIPDDVLEVMSAKLTELDESSRLLLAQAACVGARFEIGALELVSGQTKAELAAELYELVDTGLLALVGHAYRFAHDRIQDAAREFLSPQARRRLHWEIGRYELDRAEGLVDEQLFELVDHLDAGIPEMLASSTRLELAELNLHAGQRALDTAAYDAALRYLDVGLSLVSEWRGAAAKRGRGEPQYELVVGLAFARAQVLTLAARHEEATAEFDELLGWRLDVEQFGQVAARRIRLLTLEDRPEDAVALGLEAVARCGFEVSAEPGRVRTGIQLLRAWLSVRGRGIDELMALPECTDPAVNAAMEIAAATKIACYVVNSRTLMALIELHVRLFLRHGFHPSCPLALAQLAIGVGPGLGQIEEAIHLCELGLALAERAPLSSVRAQVESAAYLFVWHLGRPFSEPIAHLDDAYQRALEAGDFEYAGFMGALGLSMHFDVGTHLRVVERLSRHVEEDIGRWGSHEMVLVAWMIRGLAVMLAGREDELGPDQSDVYTALDAEVVAARGGSRVSVYAARVNLGMLRLLLDDPDAALAAVLEVIDDVEQVMLGSWMVARAALLAVVAGGGVLEARQSISPRAHAAMAKGRKILRRWARGCPANFAHYRDLADGVHLGLRGRPDRAMRVLERARVHAAEQGCRWVEGLAAEQLAKLAEREGLVSFARGARAQAWAAYEAWGAAIKLAALRTRHPEQFPEPGSAASGSRYERLRADLGGSATSAEALDLESILQAVRMMTEDLRLDEVVGRVLDAAIANAGADRGLLLLEREGSPELVAEAEVGGERHVYDTAVPLSEAEELCPSSLVHFALRTEQALVIDDARTDARFCGDPYVVRTGVQSLLCMPILKGRRHLGALVLENRLSAYCFTPERLEGLALIAGQAAIALDNARLFAALRRSEARWRSLVDGAPDVILLLNERGEIEFVNRGSLVDASEDGESEPGGRLLEKYLSPASAEDWRRAVAAVLREGVQLELELEVARAGAEPSWFVARLAPIEVEAEVGGEARHAVAVATDITARKHAEVERHALEAQLRQQQRLESVGTLASGVAHEINNPVQGILNYAELISDNLDDQEVVQEFAHEITTESNRVASIVRNLLQFSRQEREATMEDADLRELLDATLSLIRAVLRKDHIRLDVAIPEDLPKVRCRVQQIQQIIMNLVTNARDALNERYQGYDERKLIEIRAERLEPKALGQRTRVRLIVEDHGPGIPPDLISRIFDPFFTTKGRDQGTGLGLSVSHGIAHEHGGELTVETRRGEWTRFRLDLPVAE
jgi:predicted ATPase/signal transduction histidine kinase/tRNA A-37 threonylcarbamoyl transferase component Bud32